jgi:hypothetical protein
MDNYYIFADVNIMNVENKNCTEVEVEQLLDLFEPLVRRTASSPSSVIHYKLDQLRNTKTDIADFKLIIERKPIDETNKIFDDTESFDYYIATFNNKALTKKLSVEAVVINNMTQNATLYEQQ